MKSVLRSPDFDPVADVEEFHTHFGINYEGPPRALPDDLALFRYKFLREELNELEKHYDSVSFELDKLTRSPAFRYGPYRFIRSAVTEDLAGALDALADLVYVALGTAHLHGFDFREAWRRVHAANMRKYLPEGAPTTPEERVKMKIMKPPGWVPPDHTDLVSSHIHDDSEEKP